MDQNLTGEKAELLNDTILSPTLALVDTHVRTPRIPRQINFKQLFLKGLVLAGVLISRTYIPYLLIAPFNRRFKFLKSVFICYSAEPRYANHYSFKFAENWQKYEASPIGFLNQGRHWGLAFGTTMGEKDFLSESNSEKVTSLLNHISIIAKILGITKIRYSGVLPRVAEKLVGASPEQSNLDTARTVTRAIEITRAKFSHTLAQPVILLGGNGFVGKKVQDFLRELGITFFVVDPQQGLAGIPIHLRDTAAVLLDVSRKGVLEKYSAELWPDLVILNETYPEPSRKFRQHLKMRGIKLFHIAGVKGRIFPPLPFAYSESVPCCAIHDEEAEILPIIREL